MFFCLWEDKLKLRGGLGDDFSRFSRFQAVLRGERQLGQRVLEVAMVGEGDKLTARTKMEEYLKQQLVQESVKKP